VPPEADLRVAIAIKSQRTIRAAMGAKRTPLCPATFQRATLDHILNKGPRW